VRTDLCPTSLTPWVNTAKLPDSCPTAAGAALAPEITTACTPLLCFLLHEAYLRIPGNSGRQSGVHYFPITSLIAKLIAASVAMLMIQIAANQPGFCSVSRELCISGNPLPSEHWRVPATAALSKPLSPRLWDALHCDPAGGQLKSSGICFFGGSSLVVPRGRRDGRTKTAC
jgi:hypothetical protein